MSWKAGCQLWMRWRLSNEQIKRVMPYRISLSAQMLFRQGNFRRDRRRSEAALLQMWLHWVDLEINEACIFRLVSKATAGIYVKAELNERNNLRIKVLQTHYPQWMLKTCFFGLNTKPDANSDKIASSSTQQHWKNPNSIQDLQWEKSKLEHRATSIFKISFYNTLWSNSPSTIPLRMGNKKSYFKRCIASRLKNDDFITVFENHLKCLRFFWSGARNRRRPRNRNASLSLKLKMELLGEFFWDFFTYCATSPTKIVSEETLYLQTSFCCWCW